MKHRSNTESGNRRPCFCRTSIRAISSRPPPPSDASRQPKCAYFSRNWGLSANSDWLAEGVRPPSCARVSRPPPQRPIEGSPLRPKGGKGVSRKRSGTNVHSFKCCQYLKRYLFVPPFSRVGQIPDLTKT